MMTNIQHIQVGINLSEHSPTVFKFALRLAQYLEAELRVVLVLTHDEVSNLYSEDNAIRKERYENFRQEKSKALWAFIEKNFGKQYENITVKTEIRIGNPYEELCLVAQEQQVDLLVVGKYQKGGLTFFDDTTNKLIDHCPCPLFIIPEGVTFQAFRRIIYTSDFILEDCAAILYLQSWLAVFKAELVGIHICKRLEDKPATEKRIALLKKLFPQDNINFRCIVASVERGINRYSTLSKSDMIAMTHRERYLWGAFLKPSISKMVAGETKVPLVVFQQENLKIN